MNIQKWGILLTTMMLLACSDEGWTVHHAQTVVRIDEALDEELIEATLRSVDLWNEKLGAKVLVAKISARAENCDEIAVFAANLCKGLDCPLGKFDSKECGGTVRYDEQLPVKPHPWLLISEERRNVVLDQLAAHELGHALGLHHDPGEVFEAWRPVVPLMEPYYSVRWAPEVEILLSYVQTVRNRLALNN